MEEKCGALRHLLLVRLPRRVEIHLEDAYLALLGATRPPMGYHISVLGPFLLLDPEGERFSASVSAVCQRWRAYRVCIGDLGVYEARDDNVVHLTLVNPAKTVALHDALLAATSGMVEPQDERYRQWSWERYQPHVTLGLKVGDQAAEWFRQMAAVRRKRESFRVSAISWVSQMPSHPWQSVREFSFGTPGGQGRAAP